MNRIAVVLLNLGGPDSKSAIRPFLKNFFMDPNIIGAPLPVRWMVSRLIAWSRGREGGAAFKNYAELGFCSPLLKNTEAQALALERKLQSGGGAEYKTFIAMRYWNPQSFETARAVKAYRPDQVVLLPLYPQFSTTTTWSSLGVWNEAARSAGLTCAQSTVCCYPDEQGFVAASAQNIREAYYQAQRDCGRAPRILFSAHGLPEKIIESGDPYRHQCEAAAAAIMAALAIGNADWQSCYQSRVGPLKWIGPSTEEALQQAAADNMPVIVYPHAFVSEHVETLVEIEREYRHLATGLGIPYFARVPTVSAHEYFIEGLARMVRAQAGKTGVSPGTAYRCPSDFGRCCLRAEQGSERLQEARA